MYSSGYSSGYPYGSSRICSGFGYFFTGHGKDLLGVSCD